MPRNIFLFWKIALFGGLLVFSGLFWLNDFVGYSAKSAILVNGHNDNQDDVLAKTVAAFGGTDVFVKRTLSSTRTQESIVGTMNSEAQLDALDHVRVSGGEKGGLVMVKVSNADKEVAELLSMEATETLLRMSRIYIGDQTEFTNTVIDKAIVTKGLIQPWEYVIKSVTTALGLLALILLLEPLAAWLMKHTRSFLRKRKGHESERIQEETAEALDQRFVPQKLDPASLYPGAEVPSEPLPPQTKASEIVKNEVYGKTPLQSVSVSMEDLPFTFETPLPTSVIPEEEEKNSIEPFSSEEILPADQEPSVLEYKRRLNELLAQK